MFSGISLYKKTKSRISGCSVTFPFELPVVDWLVNRSWYFEALPVGNG